METWPSRQGSWRHPTGIQKPFIVALPTGIPVAKRSWRHPTGKPKPFIIRDLPWREWAQGHPIRYPHSTTTLWTLKKQRRNTYTYLKKGYTTRNRLVRQRYFFFERTLDENTSSGKNVGSENDVRV
jgi:hypothetical protein